MNHNIDDTIAALATPSGRGAISVIRVSGKDAFEVVESCFLKWKEVKKRLGNKEQSIYRELNKEEFFVPVTFSKERTTNRFLGIIVNNDEILDEVIVSTFHSPHSYTGEDLVEISCHCNSYIIQQIMQLLLRKSRLSKPGEFTQRAFFNNKIDLTQAEAVGDLLNAVTKASHQTAMMQLEGSLRHNISSLLEELTQKRLRVEMEIDFSEQDAPEIDTNELKRELTDFRDKLRKLVNTGKEGRILREGLIVCLAGVPNVGKSSLFNRLLESDRAIVTEKPGTTRDYLEETLSIDGYLVRLIDTAGLCKTQEEAEAIGVGISCEIIKKSDRVLLIEDGYLRWERRYESLLTEMEDKPQPNIRGSICDGKPCVNFDQDIKKAGLDEKVIHILNKADILDKETILEYESHGFLPVSAKTGLGIEKLKSILVSELSLGKKDLDEGILTNVRQINAVERSLEAIEHSLTALKESAGMEFIAFDLKVASEALEEIIGKVTDDDLLNKIFSDFCIGK